MARTNLQLQKIGEQLQKLVNAQHPGVGMVLMLFDVSDDRSSGQPVAAVLHGSKEGKAIRLMRETADLIERGAPPDQRQSRIIIPGS